MAGETMNIFFTTFSVALGSIWLSVKDLMKESVELLRDWTITRIYAHMMCTSAMKTSLKGKPCRRPSQ
jgi:hypothetical protein